MEGNKNNTIGKTSSIGDFWYFIGLLATDGCLLNDGRHINITSADKEYLQQILDKFGLKNKVGSKKGGSGSAVYQFYITSAVFWRNLLKLGLAPRKSLTMGPLAVPPLFFYDFLRGVIDGDGNIRRWIHPQNGGEQWELRIYSASPQFSNWLYKKICHSFTVTGTIITYHPKPPRHTMHVLKFGKMAARNILAHCYKNGETLSLLRKQKLAEQCVTSYVGWTRSLTTRALKLARVA